MNETLELRKIEELLTKPPQNVDVDFIYTNNDRKPAWLRFLKGAYDMPVTWWIGIIHCTMLAGIWGNKYKSAAQINQQRGAALIAVGSGYNTTHDVVYSIITGTAQRFPPSKTVINLGIEELKEKAKDEINDPEELIVLIEALNDIQPDTMKSYDDWCETNPDLSAEAYFCQ